MQFFSCLTGLFVLLQSTTTLAANSPGCGKVLSFGGGTHTLTVNGKEREYIVKIPENYDPEHPYRLIFTFHALGGSAEQIANGGMGTQPYYGLVPFANETAIFISPNGQTAGSVGGFTGWANTGGEDILFVDAMIEAIEQELCINQDLRFTTGFSYGGAISYAIACARPDKFRAVAVLSSGPISGCDGGKDPIAYYHQHGTRDQVLPITMGRQMRDTFVKNNGCTPLADEPMPRGDSPTTEEYEGCKEGYPVKYVVFEGDHTPAAAEPGSTEPFGPPNTWEFFSRFDLDLRQHCLFSIKGLLHDEKYRTYRFNEESPQGDIGRKRKKIYEMLCGCCCPCIKPDPDSRKPFVADAIIAIILPLRLTTVLRSWDFLCT
ncbi:hypothetical protein jhhlp_008226 [Lomentospora prolificans]|uniref:feruloyl esterase n=1 Tax=Lomentospora prolificans TaxID=41688 RepID=A0A2N3MXF2_9PEZI|nr:hypothetical protein jhhlp_008226 [Lomentospora prolificans]